MLKPTQVIESFIGKLDQQVVKAGETIFTEGEPGSVMYGLLQGEVEFTVNDKVVETISPGDVFGVGALVQLNHQRASTAKAKTDCQLIIVNKENFLFLTQETPVFSLEVMRSYSDRLIRLKHNI